MAVDDTLGVDLDSAKVADFDILSDEARQNWRSLVAKWAGSSPVYSISNGVPYLVITSYADNVELLRGDQSERWTTHWGAGSDAFDLFSGLPIIVNLGGADHKRVRSAMQPAFGQRGIGVKAGFIESTVQRLLDEIAAKGGEFDFMADFGRKVISDVLLRGLLGTNPEDVEAFETFAYELPTVYLHGHTPDYRRAFDAVMATSDAMLERGKDRQTDDFVGRMVAACHDGQLSRDEFVGGIMTICTGGLSSTSAAAGMMMYLMCRNPEQREQVRQDPELVPAAVEEALRCHPAGLAIQPRFSAVETEIGGTVVYPGMPIVPCVPMANYDPAQFENPWEFQLGRKGRHLAFGQGIHMCIGAVLARKIMTVTLAGFLERFPGLRLVDPEFTPTYQGVVGEFHPRELPMQIS